MEIFDMEVFDLEPPADLSLDGNDDDNPGKLPLFAAALSAKREGRLSAPPRATTVRDVADYEQNLSYAEAMFPEH